MKKLADQSCQALSGEEHRLSPADAQALLKQLQGWKLSVSGDAIEREMVFEDFPTAINYINALAELAEKENHHPDFALSYSRLELALSTHDVGGLSRNDFILAAKLDALLEK